jgi:hypothetical protein
MINQRGNLIIMAAHHGSLDDSPVNEHLLPADFVAVSVVAAIAHAS